jgi:beta-alanine--pyruvate transaminase
VITGFGRLGHAFAAERYGVTPDILCFAKGITAGAVPMGGVIARESLYDGFMRGPERAIELFHGYTYSGHPLACAAGIAALDLYRDEDLFGRAKRLEPRFADAAMTLKGLPGVLDVRTVGISAGVDLTAKPGAPGERGYEAMERAFHDEDLVIRITGDTLAIAPPLIVSEAQTAEIFEKTARVIRAVIS